MRGDIYALTADRHARGHEQQGRRYGVVVQATRYLHLSRWLVAPTSASAQPAVFRPTLRLASGPTVILCDAMSAVDPELRLGELVGHATLAEVEAIDRALLVLLDLL